MQTEPDPGGGALAKSGAGARVTRASDAALVEAARGGDHVAFAELLARHRPLALALVQRMLGSGAEDVLQEASLQAFLGLDGLRRPERFGSWLAGIALNVARMWSRHARGAATWSLDGLLGGTVVDEPVSTEPDPAAYAEASELAARVRSAVDGLPRGQRAAVLLFYLAGLSHLEVAEHLGVPVGAVKTRLHKARAQLRRQFAWQEVAMSEDMIEMRIYDVVRQPEREHPPLGHSPWAVRLQEIGGERRLDIGIGRFEGESLALSLGRVEVLRPLTFAFTASLLRAAGARLKEVRVNRLEAKTFYAQAIVHTASGEQSVDARPSDALNLALVQNAPVYVASELLDQEVVFKIDPEAVRLEALVAEARGNVDRWRSEHASEQAAAQQRP